jgi:hypothetical protein
MEGVRKTAINLSKIICFPADTRTCHNSQTLSLAPLAWMVGIRILSGAEFYFSWPLRPSLAHPACCPMLGNKVATFCDCLTISSSVDLQNVGSFTYTSLMRLCFVVLNHRNSFMFCNLWQQFSGLLSVAVEIRTAQRAGDSLLASENGCPTEIWLV